MKIFKYLFLVNIILSLSVPLFAQQGAQPVGPAGRAVSDKPASGKMPPMTEDDLNEMVKVLETLDQDTLDSLAKIGEEYIKEMEAQGKDPFEELFGIPGPQGEAETETEVSIPAPPIVEQKPIEQIEIPKLCVEGKQCREMLKNIAEKIAAIRQKALENRRNADLLKPWHYHLDDIVYFAHTLAEDKLLKYVTDKEFEKLHKAYSQLNHELNHLEPLFVVRETTLEDINPYILLGTTTDASWQDVNTAYQKLYAEKHPEKVKQTLKKEGKPEAVITEKMTQAQKEFDELSNAYNAILQKEQAQQALNSILESFSRAIYVNNIILESKKVLEKYEPEALKLKEQEEALEKKARQEQDEALRRRPPYSPPVFDREAFGRPAFGAAYDDYLTTTPSDTYGGPTDMGRPGFEPTKPADKDKRKPEKDKDKPQPRKPSDSKKVEKKLKIIDDMFKEIANSVNETSLRGVKPGKIYFKKPGQFADYLKKDLTPEDEIMAKEINIRLGEITYALNRVKNEISDERLKGFSTAEKKELKDATKKLFNEYFEKDKDKGLLYNKMKALLKLPVIIKEKKLQLNTSAVTVSESKKNIHLGLEKDIAENIDDPKYRSIKEARGAYKNESILEQFLDVFHKLNIQFKETPKPVGAGIGTRFLITNFLNRKKLGARLSSLF